ncbi:MAG TPA: hypothetical protein VFH62_00200, partial [Dehalococcoidia bacterium]|nr:hypothetical protein [Dehalococcoidia bacterium]
VSHDRYFVDKLATKIIEIGGGDALVYPGTYEEFLWSQKKKQETAALKEANQKDDKAEKERRQAGKPQASETAPQKPDVAAQRNNREEQIQARRAKKEADARRRRIEELESRIAEREEEIKTLEAQMSSAGFYENHETSKPVLDRHQALMWEVGELMNRWEALSSDEPRSHTKM